MGGDPIRTASYLTQIEQIQIFDKIKALKKKAKTEEQFKMVEKYLKAYAAIMNKPNFRVLFERQLIFSRILVAPGLLIFQ